MAVKTKAVLLEELRLLSEAFSEKEADIINLKEAYKVDLARRKAKIAELTVSVVDFNTVKEDLRLLGEAYSNKEIEIVEITKGNAKLAIKANEWDESRRDRRLKEEEALAKTNEIMELKIKVSQLEELPALLEEAYKANTQNEVNYIKAVNDFNKVNHYLNTYRNGWSAFMKNIQGGLENAVELSAFIDNAINPPTKENN